MARLSDLRNPHEGRELRNAWTLGERAGQSGEDLGACPYDSMGGAQSRALRDAWYAGHAVGVGAGVAVDAPDPSGEPREPDEDDWLYFERDAPDARPGEVPPGHARAFGKVDGWPAEVRWNGEYAYARLEAFGVVGVLLWALTKRRWDFVEVKAGPFSLRMPQVSLDDRAAEALDRLRDECERVARTHAAATVDDPRAALAPEAEQ